MKTLSTAILITLLGLTAQASTNPTSAEFKFTFHPPKANSFIIKKSAASKDVAFKLAAKECFQKLTHGTYPGEERGLDIIDICANPKM